MQRRFGEIGSGSLNPREINKNCQPNNIFLPLYVSVLFSNPVITQFYRLSLQFHFTEKPLCDVIFTAEQTR
jgi:hypothetical protein